MLLYFPISVLGYNYDRLVASLSKAKSSELGDRAFHRAR